MQAGEDEALRTLAGAWGPGDTEECPLERRAEDDGAPRALARQRLSERRVQNQRSPLRDSEGQRLGPGALGLSVPFTVTSASGKVGDGPS